MSGAYSQVDASGNYLANIILKNGRNEVQTYPLSHREGVLVDTHIKRHELQPDQAVSCATWFNDQPEMLTPKKSAKRKADASGGAAPGATVASLLAVALEDGQVWVFSPLRDDVVAVVHGAGKLVSLTRGHTENCFWGLTAAAALVQIHAFDAVVTKTLAFAKTDADVALVSHCGLRKAAAQLVLLASARVHVVDTTKSRRNVVAEWGAGDGAIAFVAAVSPSVFAVARDLSGTLALHDVSGVAAPRTLQCQGSNITRLAVVGGALVAFTEHGAEVFAVDGGDPAPVACIRTDDAARPLENLVANAANGLVGVWYDGNQPQFVAVGDHALVEGRVVPLQQPSRGGSSPEPLGAQEPRGADSDEAPSDAEQVGAGELLAQLAQRLAAAKVPKKEVVRLCTSTADEDTIKDAVRLFSQAERGGDLAASLFEIVSKKVAADPSRKLSLSIWLKWILLTHGGYISKQERLAGSLRLLQSSLDGGMDMMAKLLALQGRLQLLKSQAELRNTSGPVEHDDSEQDDDEFNDTFNNTQNIEELVVYANGENDDDFVSMEQDA